MTSKNGTELSALARNNALPSVAQISAPAIVGIVTLALFGLSVRRQRS